MALGEIAKSLQVCSGRAASSGAAGFAAASSAASGGEASAEILWLREMRQYVNTHAPEIDSDWKEIKAFEDCMAAGDKAAEYRLCSMIQAVRRKSRTVELYKKYLGYAEKAERREKGAAERFIRNAGPQMKGRLAAIEVEYKESLKLLEESYREK